MLYVILCFISWINIFTIFLPHFMSIIVVLVDCLAFYRCVLFLAANLDSGTRIYAMLKNQNSIYMALLKSNYVQFFFAPFLNYFCYSLVYS